MSCFMMPHTFSKTVPGMAPPLREVDDGSDTADVDLCAGILNAQLHSVGRPRCARWPGLDRVWAEINVRELRLREVAGLGADVEALVREAVPELRLVVLHELGLRLPDVGFDRDICVLHQLLHAREARAGLHHAQRSKEPVAAARLHLLRDRALELCEGRGVASAGRHRSASAESCRLMARRIDLEP